MNHMFQSTDSSNDEICGFDGESHANGKRSKSFEQTIHWSNCDESVKTFTISHFLFVSLGEIFHINPHYISFPTHSFLFSIWRNAFSSVKNLQFLCLRLTDENFEQ